MIDTKRLTIRPMNAQELRLALDNPAELDRLWGLEVRHNAELEEDSHLREANEFRLKMVLEHCEHPDDYLWYTHWNLIHKADSVIIGGIMVMSEPNEQGEVEFGYGTDAEYQNRGYMTEAVGAMAKWAFKNPAVKYVIAETEKENTPSHRVLSKNGFEIYRVTAGEFWWRLAAEK